MSGSSFKKCLSCSEIKDDFCFSWKSKKDKRRDTTCSYCRNEQKKNRRKANRKSNVSSFEFQNKIKNKVVFKKNLFKNRAKGEIEPVNNQTEEVLSYIDFTEEEKTYEVKLNDSQRYDMIERFNLFIDVLKHGYEELSGDKVYIIEN